jgi:hypothetical protein
VTDADLRSIVEDLRTATELSDYEATEVLWVALVKMSNLLPESNEHRRMLALVARIPGRDIQRLLESPAVGDLLNLDPPLETVISSPHERLDLAATLQAIRTVRSAQDGSPHEAMVGLGEILKRVRNKRAHGFKTRSGPRDQEILRAARRALAELCGLGVEALSPRRL